MYLIAVTQKNSLTETVIFQGNTIDGMGPPERHCGVEGCSERGLQGWRVRAKGRFNSMNVG